MAESRKSVNYVAIGVVTYNHPEIVAHVLENCCKVYKACHLDVYYYDSSEGNETENVVTEYIRAGYDNFHYLRLQAGLGSAEKAALFFSGYGIEQKYDYFWLMKDRVMCESSTIMQVYLVASLDKPDIILINNYGDHETSSSESISDATEFYRKWGWEVTSMDTTLCRTDTILKDYDPPKEQIPESDPIFYFLHFDMVFRRLAALENPEIKVLSEPNIRLLSSDKGAPGWMKQLFTIWVDRWMQINESLPDCYNAYKADVIRGKALPREMQTEEGLRWLCEAGALRKELLPDLLPNWEKVSAISKERLISIVMNSTE